MLELKFLSRQLDEEKAKNQQLSAMLDARSVEMGRLDDSAVITASTKRSSSSLLVDNQLVELEKHANQLHHLWMVEKSKVRFLIFLIYIN